MALTLRLAKMFMLSSDTPFFSTSHLTSSRCPPIHAKWMGCRNSLSLAVSDHPFFSTNHLTTSSCPFLLDCQMSLSQPLSSPGAPPAALKPRRQAHRQAQGRTEWIQGTARAVEGDAHGCAP